MCTFRQHNKDEDCAWKVAQTSAHRVRGARGESTIPGSVHMDVVHRLLQMLQVLWPRPSTQVWRKQARSCVNRKLLSSNGKPYNPSPTLFPSIPFHGWWHGAGCLNARLEVQWEPNFDGGAATMSRPQPRVSRVHDARSTSTSGKGSSWAAGSGRRSPLRRRRRGATSCASRRKVDVVLSSGFLAFAYHVGFLEAVMDSSKVSVQGIMGTSAGALTGSLLAAGYSAESIADELSRVAPMQLLRPSQDLRNGALSLQRVVQRLEVLLPPTFEDLPHKFAVGVVGSDGKHHLIHQGPLAEAVAASAAIPGLFEPVHVKGFEHSPCSDGGAVDRVGLKQWRAYRRNSKDGRVYKALVHVIGRSSPFSGADDVENMGEEDIWVVHSPKSGQSLVSLGDFEDQRQMAYERTTLAFKTAWDMEWDGAAQTFQG